VTEKKSSIAEAALASLVAGAALAAGAELWSFFSPKARRERDAETLRDLEEGLGEEDQE